MLMFVFFVFLHFENLKYHLRMNVVDIKTLDWSVRYTYADYLQWIDEKACELIDGFIKMMPAPRPLHARVSFNIAGNLWAILKKNKGKCEVFSAPFDVRFPKNGETADNKVYTVVQPDICVVCDPSKIDERGCCGAPDMIVEILSPSTGRRDLTEKFALYEEAGVKEYWVVYPDAKAITVFLLQDNGKYDNGYVYEFGVSVPIFVFDNQTIELNDIFE